MSAVSSPGTSPARRSSRRLSTTMASGSTSICTKAGETGLLNVQEICVRISILGLRGKVTLSHGFCLGQVNERQDAAAADLMAAAKVAVVTHGAGGLPLPPVEMLRAAGALGFAGNGDIDDVWPPYSSADLPKRAAITGWKGNFRRHDQVETAFDLIRRRPCPRAQHHRLRHCAARPRHALLSCVQQYSESRRRASAAQTGAGRRQDRRARRRRALRSHVCRLR